MKFIIASILSLGFLMAKAQEESFSVEQFGKTGFSQILQNKQLLVIGELHGTEEIPAVVFNLTKALKKQYKRIRIGLEIDALNQPLVDSFLKTGDRRMLERMDFFTSPVKDGRSSKAMAMLISNLQKLKIAGVFCFDGKAANSQMRDSLMAKRIQDHLEEGTMTIVLVGNVHAKKKTVSFGEGSPPFKPMTYLLSQWIGESFINLNTLFAGGSTWICMEDGCSTHTMPAKPNLLQRYGKNTRLIFNRTTEGYDGFIYIQKGTASTPLRP